MKAWLMLPLLALAACASLAPRANCAAWQEMVYCLQPAGSVAPFWALQKIDVHRAGRSESLIVSLEADESGLRLAGLTPLGHKVMQVMFDDRGIVVEAALPEGDVLARQIIALVQLVWWPSEAVRAGLMSGGPLLEDGPAMRRLVLDGRPLLAISYGDSGQVTIVDSMAGAEILIAHLEGQKP